MLNEYFQTDASRSVNFHGVQISGNLGPNVVVETDGVSARTVYSGEGAGDVYHVRTSAPAESGLPGLLTRLREQGRFLPTERLNDLIATVTDLWHRAEKKALDPGYLFMGLNYVREVAPAVLPDLTRTLGQLAQRVGAGAMAEYIRTFR